MRTYTGIQAMRGVAAISVVCGHAVTMRFGLGIPPDVALGALYILQAGVDVFFVISGFIIATSAAANPSPVTFAWRRAVRIFPVYWLVLAAAVVSAQWIDVFPRAPYFSYQINGLYLLSLTTENWYVAPAWSLCYELYFYAAVLVILAISPAYVFEVLLAALAFVIAADVFNIPLGIYSEPIVLEFGLGVLIAFAVRIKFTPGFPLIAIGLSAALFYTGWHYINKGQSSGGLRLLTYGMGSACLIYAVVLAEHRGARFPVLMQRLGDVSYSLYLSHHLLMTWLSLGAVSWLPGPLQIAGWIALAVTLASFMHRFVEKPLLRWSHRVGAPINAAPLQSY